LQRFQQFQSYKHINASHKFGLGVENDDMLRIATYILAIGVAAVSYGSNLQYARNGMTEICDNLVDDDGDGLIDVFDSDCTCGDGSIFGNTYVSNPGFEEHSGCCGEIMTSTNCVDDWHPIGGTPDYYGLDCESPASVQSIEQNFSTTFDDSFLALGTAGNFSETMGTCLRKTLNPGEIYVLEIAASFPTDLLMNLPSPQYLGVYGFSGQCPDFSNLLAPSTINFCDSALPNQGELLARISSEDILNLEFSTYVNTFAPSNNIDYIVLSLECNSSNVGNAIFQVAYLQITSTSTTTSWDYDESISSTDPCESLAQLSLPSADSLAYQWFKDSVPMPGQVSSTLEFTQSNNTASSYHVFVYNDNGCKLLGPQILSSVTNTRTSIQDSTCSGSSYPFGDDLVSEAGTYFDTLVNQWGCDSILELRLSIASNPIRQLSRSFCEGGSYFFAGNLIDQAGLYYDTVAQSGSCDSILILDLQMIGRSSFAFQDSFCVGKGYSFGNETLTQAGLYFDTLANALGCDSIVTLELLSSANKTRNISQVICEADSFFFNNTWISESGLYSDTLLEAQGCDSLLFLNLEVLSAAVSSLQDSFCPGSTYQFIDRAISEAGVYQDTLLNHLGCDSIIRLTLIEKDEEEVFLEREICQGGVWEIGSKGFSESGAYSVILENDDGCDTLMSLVLKVQDAVLGDTTIAYISEGESYHFHNGNYTIEGLHEKIIPSAQGCDSLTFLDLRLNSSLYIPNVFSSDPTSANNHFAIFSGKELQVRKYQIYDRWGKTMFLSHNFTTSEGMENFWDGFVQGRRASKGVYVYKIEYVDESEEIKRLSGTLTLL